MGNMASSKCNGHHDQAQEKTCTSPSSGTKSIAYELWFKPVVENARLPNVSPMRGNKNMGIDYLKQKLKNAEERKKSYEDGILSRLAAREAYAKHVKAIANQQQKLAEEKLKEKMETYEQNKEALEKAKLERLLAKDEHVKEVQASLQVMAVVNSKIAEGKLQQKLAVSNENAEALKKAQQEKLQAHQRHIKEVQNMAQGNVALQSRVAEQKIKLKMSTITENRKSCLAALKSRLHEKSLDIEQKKQTYEEIQVLQAKIYEENLLQKMEKYGQNLKAVQKTKQDQLEAHRKHGERVRTIAKDRKNQVKQG